MWGRVKKQRFLCSHIRTLQNPTGTAHRDPVSRFSSPPQKSEAAAAAGRVLLQTGNSQFGAPLLTGASSQEKSRWVGLLGVMVSRVSGVRSPQPAEARICRQDLSDGGGSDDSHLLLPPRTADWLDASAHTAMIQRG
jgi:hypothetical protein